MDVSKIFDWWNLISYKSSQFVSNLHFWRVFFTQTFNRPLMGKFMFRLKLTWKTKWMRELFHDLSQRSESQNSDITAARISEYSDKEVSQKTQEFL